MRTSLTVVLVVAMVLPACGESDTGDAAAIDVVATTTILGDIAQAVGRGDVEVTVLMPRGADPHGFQLSSRQAATIAEADLVLANGLGLEPGLDDVLDAAVDDGANVVRVGELVDPLPFGDHEKEYEDEEHEEENEQHEHGDLDPHFWFDPLRVAEAADVIAAEFTSLDTGIDWTARADGYRAELTEADDEIGEILSVVPADRRRLVTNHDSLGYFADRYDFAVVGTVVPGGATLAEPSSAELAELVETVERESIPVIFAETTEPARLAEAVAAEVGFDVAVVELWTGSLGEPGSGAETLIEMLLTDARLIADALA
jgi:zinc/manganese transport system substrate-binding protein